MSELSIIQKTYDFVKWFVPILERLPRNYKFSLGDRITTGLYDLLEGLIRVRYARQKTAQLHELNVQLEVLRYQTRLLHDFQLINTKRYEHISRQLNAIGGELGGWIKQQRQLTLVE